MSSTGSAPRGLRKVVSTVLLILIGLLGMSEVALHISGPAVKGQSRLGQLQRFAGILPTELRFSGCAIKPSLGMYVESAQYAPSGRIWTYGLFPTFLGNTAASAPFVMLASRGGAERIALTQLDPQLQKSVMDGRSNCTMSGNCVEMPNALNSGKLGLLTKTSPAVLLVPELGLSATLYAGKPNWLICS
jgi:hypothetical protein